MNAPSQILSGNVGGAVSGITGGASQGVGQDIGSLINALVPAVPIANQYDVQQAANEAQAQAVMDQGYSTQYNNQAQGTLAQTQGALSQAQGTLNQADQANLGQGSNVQNSLALLQAQANGTAPSAAQAQLQAGNDQAVAQQHALANSGNLSQMIGGQRAAMLNAGTLAQSNANQATQLRANQQATGQQAYASGAAQQASTANQNAALQQQQTAQLGSLYGTQAGLGSTYAGAANSAIQNQAATDVSALQTQQQALGQTAQYRAQALGGMMNGAGGLASSILSDENTKTNIQSESTVSRNNSDPSLQTKNRPAYQTDEPTRSQTVSSGFGQRDEAATAAAKPSDDSITGAISRLFSDKDSKKEVKRATMLEKFLDQIEPVSFEYKKTDGVGGRTPGTHLGVIAQQIEKAPGGASMIRETPEGKVIDIPSAVGTLLAAVADSHDRIKEIEELFKTKGKK